jgi:MFS family permease
MTYRGNVWRLLTVQALIMFILWVPIWVVFLQEKGISLSQIGVLEAFAWILTAALEVPTGALADKWGRKLSIAMGAFVYSMAMLFILADALSPIFLLGYAMWNASFAFVSGAEPAILYDTLRADGRESEASKYTGRSNAIQQGSQGVAALAGAALATVDITLCFTICALTGLAATALVLTVREPPQREEGVEPLGYWRNLRTAVGIAARRPLVRALVLVSAAFWVVPLVVYYFLLQPYAIGVGLPVASLGLVVVGVQAATVAASWLAYRAGQRTELRGVVSAGTALFVLACLILGVIPSVPAVALMLVVATVPAIVSPLLTARLNDLIPSAQRATILSLSALLSELGTAGAVPLLMTLADVLDPPSAVGLSAALFGVIVVPLLFVWRSAEARPAIAS